MKTTDDAVDALLGFSVPGAPQSKLRARRSNRGKWYTPRPSAEAEQRMKAAFMQMWGGRYDRPHAGELAVELVFWLPTRRRCDLDNLTKLVTDAASGVVYNDDSQIWMLWASKAYSTSRPRTDISIYSLSGGLTDDERAPTGPGASPPGADQAAC